MGKNFGEDVNEGARLERLQNINFEHKAEESLREVNSEIHTLKKWIADDCHFLNETSEEINKMNFEKEFKEALIQLERTKDYKRNSMVAFNQAIDLVEEREQFNMLEKKKKVRSYNLTTLNLSV